MKKLKTFFSAVRFNATEKALLIYLLITALYILAGVNKLQDVFAHLLVRVVITIVILIFAGLFVKFKNNKLYNLLRYIYPFLFLGFLYKETGYMNNIIFDYFDPWFVKAEQYLWGMQPSLEFSKYFPYKWFSELMNFGYFFYYFLMLGTALAVFYYNRSKTDKTVFIIIASFLIYYLFFALIPVEGPQFYFPPDQTKTVDSYVFSYLVKAVQASGETQTGAFPSSHVGMSVIALILTFKYAGKIFYVILLPVILLWFATVYIKAHYLIDTIMGFPSGYLLYWVTDKLYFRFNNINQ